MAREPGLRPNSDDSRASYHRARCGTFTGALDWTPFLGLCVPNVAPRTKMPVQIKAARNRSRSWEGEELEIIYHGGMHKTGTTAVQTWLKENASLLGLIGICAHTPTTLGPFFQTDDETLRKRIVALVADASAAGFERIIISHEGMSFARPERLALLARPANGMRTRFVLTIRHWNGFLPSRWQQNVLRADGQSFHAMMRQLMAPESRHLNLRYDLLIDALIAAGFAELAFLSYENAQRRDGILAAVLAASDVGLPQDLPLGSRKVHESGRIADSDILRIYNSIRAWREDKPTNPLHDARAYGTPFAHVFDHSLHRVVPVLDRVLPEVRHRLSNVEPYNLRVTDFAPLAQKVEVRAASYLRNPEDGRLFQNIDDRVIEASTLELSDFTLAERNMIWNAVNDPMDFVLTGRAQIGPVRVA